MTIIKVKIQNTELFITIIPSFQEPGFIFVRVVEKEHITDRIGKYNLAMKPFKHYGVYVLQLI
jgi:hypothetical protein